MQKTNTTQQRALGEILVKQGLIAEDILADVYAQQEDKGVTLYEAVVQGRYATAEALTALEDQYLLPGTSEVGGARQPVVTTADHDDVPAAGGELGNRGRQPDLSQPIGDRAHGPCGLPQSATAASPTTRRTSGPPR